ncbi:MAG: high-affinity branched-chain amino acid ABC transporter ATP-binding protein LivG [Comamonas sp. SCN 65-56]|uniref:ABC transporter ATP-binding protein n=1 Tax=Comamonas sp. SCN 65-56 TaxID=1660095 RepID=UPI00086B2A7D|nr:ABC transporter ATP-binding protein [Comamonas sp. SCN 65-56]ODS93172.1 MAG: high-affinity branched-chain amino acid ABC transporter ATP-binding protein LivG [Comamonas sp. SCN 65-56]
MDPKRAPDRPLLDVSGVSVRFGGILALDHVSFHADAGSVCGLIGPNGAGKTTLFNCLSGLYRPYQGAIQFAGTPVLELPVHRMARLGIGRTFQNLALFGSMSVERNVMVGGYVAHSGGYLASMFGLPTARAQERALQAECRELLELLDLTSVANVPVKNLPFGTQKRVELGRALASRPKLLLLDEPAASLTHEEIGGLRHLILALREKLNLTILLVEHNMNLVMDVSDQIVVLSFGRKIADGSAEHVRSHPEVIRAYLGASA